MWLDSVLGNFRDRRLNLAAYGGRRAMEVFWFVRRIAWPMRLQYACLKMVGRSQSGGEPKHYKTQAKVINTQKAILLPKPPT
jgi:hypothetical protein